MDTYRGPTGSSAIDYIMIPGILKEFVESCKVSDCDILNTSDHESVHMVLDVELIRPLACKIERKRIRQWSKVSDADIARLYTQPVEHLLADLIPGLEQGICAPGDIDDILDSICEILCKEADNIPSTKPRRNTKPFWNKKLTELKRDKVVKFNIWKSHGRPRAHDDVTWINHNLAKKAFSRELRKVSKSYENDQIVNAIHASEIDKGIFWKMVKRSRGGVISSVHAIRNQAGKVVYSADDILETWRQHFSKLCQPKDSPNFDDAHFKEVSGKVRSYNCLDDSDQFLNEPFTVRDVQCAIDKLHCRKAYGYDNVSSEQIKYGGYTLVYALTLIYNYVVELEYIPINFRRGIQVPLYKGKNTCQLDVNNYRGITLLTNFNKIFEMLIWNRMEKWWVNEGVISGLQGACRKGQSCVHTAFLLKETVSHALETNRNVFVTYFDVSKAFDTVWTDGLFYKLYEMGVKGRAWRLLYRAYNGFQCSVRLVWDAVWHSSRRFSLIDKVYCLRECPDSIPARVRSLLRCP